MIRCAGFEEDSVVRDALKLPGSRERGDALAWHLVQTSQETALVDPHPAGGDAHSRPQLLVLHGGLVDARCLALTR